MKPPKLTKLVQGKAIGCPEHKGFVDTFNWLVDFCANLKGDDTYIEVQNPLGDHPLITFGQEFPLWGGGGGSNYKPFPAPFDFDATNNKIINCLWYMGREIKQLADYSIDTTTSKNYWLKIETDQYGQFSQSSIIPYTYAVPVAGGSFAAPSNTDTYTHYPLWSIQVSNGTVTPTFDWRTAWKTPFYSV